MRHQFSLDLPIRNEWANVDLVRTSILNCFTAVFSDIDGCHAVAMVVGELLENAIKYGVWAGEERAFRLLVVAEEHQATVTVENPTEPGDPSVDKLRAALAWLDKFASAEEAYRAKLLEVAAAPRDLGTSELGLARIAYEGNYRLKATVDGASVRVTAELAY